MKDAQEDCFKRASSAFDDRILQKKETNIFNIKKTIERFLKNKTNNPLQVY